MENFYIDNKDLKFQLGHPLMKKIVALKERNYSDKENFDYAPIDFEDAVDSYDKVLNIVGEICGSIIAPNAESVDAEGPQVINDHVKYARGTAENHRALAEAGLYGMSLPRKYDGLNFPMVPYVMAAELVSRADAGFAIFGACRTVLRPCMNLLPRSKKGDIFHKQPKERPMPWTLPSLMLVLIYRALCLRLITMRREEHGCLMV